MATFQDCTFRKAEPVEVDSDPQKRWTAQKLRLINNGNEYYGTLIGAARITKGLSASGIFLSAVGLSDCSIYTKDGSLISFDDMLSCSLLYRGDLSIDFPTISSFAHLFELNQDGHPNMPDPLPRGSMYIAKGMDSKTIEGVKIGNNDILILKKKKRVSAIKKEDLEIIDSQDKDAVHFDELMNILCGYVTLSTDQYVSGYKTFSKISVENLYIDDEKIEQKKIKSLTSDFSNISSEIRDIQDKIKGGIVYRGKLKDYGKTEISTFSYLFELNDSELSLSNHVRIGHMFSYSGGIHTIEGVRIEKGDYLISKNTKAISNITSGDIDVIDTLDSDLVRYETLSKVSSDIMSAMDDVSSLLDERLCAVEDHYGRTFTKDVSAEHSTVKFDILNMFDEGLSGMQYTLHLCCGTLVLDPKTI